jgi:hypothetical protein
MVCKQVRWNPKYLSECVQMCIGLLKGGGATSPALELIEEAAEHLECVEKYDCKFYRSQLKRGEASLRRVRQIQSWEYWLLKAGDRLLQPVPGIKNQAATMLRSALGEFDSDLRETWIKWYEQHVIEVPAYLEAE